jgi:hypothetical protein
LAKRLSEVALSVQTNTAAAKDKMAQSANSNAKTVEYKPGSWAYLDRVALGEKVISSPTDTKLSFRYLGPFQVISSRGVNARLKLPAHMQIFDNFHVSRLKPAPGPPPGADPVALSDGAQGWLVERILKRKLMDGKPHYLVKWAGFEDSHNTWEPLAHLYDVQSLVDDFNNALLAKSTRKRNKARVEPQTLPASSSSSFRRSQRISSRAP